MASQSVFLPPLLIRSDFYQKNYVNKPEDQLTCSMAKRILQGAASDRLVQARYFQYLNDYRNQPQLEGAPQPVQPDEPVSTMPSAPSAPELQQPVAEGPARQRPKFTQTRHFLENYENNEAGEAAYRSNLCCVNFLSGTIGVVVAVLVISLLFAMGVPMDLYYVVPAFLGIVALFIFTPDGYAQFRDRMADGRQLNALAGVGG